MDDSSSTTSSFTTETDILQQVLDRYIHSIAPQHSRLYAAALLTQNSLTSKSVSHTPLDYFNDIIEALSDDAIIKTAGDTVSGDKVSGQWSLLAIVLPFVPDNSIATSEAAKVAELVVKYLHVYSADVTVLSLLKCLGALPKLCNLEDWESFKIGFKTLLEYSNDIRTKVRKVAQVCVVNVFKSFKSSLVKEMAISKVISEIEKAKNCHILDIAEELLCFFESTFCVTVAGSVVIANEWKDQFSLLIIAIAGLLLETDTAARASTIFQKRLYHTLIEELEDSKIVESLCGKLSDVLRTNPNQYALDVISEIFNYRGTYALKQMWEIFLALVAYNKSESFNNCDVIYLRKCIGAALCAMGPGDVQKKLPEFFDPIHSTRSYMWLMPILKDEIMHSNLSFFAETIIPLAEACLKACEENPADREQLQSHARDCWALLPALCRDPRDMVESYGTLAELLLQYITKDAIMLDYIAIALRHLVKQNHMMSFASGEEASKLPSYYINEETAKRNKKVMKGWSYKLLEAFINVFVQVSPEKRAFLKETVGCLAMITEPSTAKKLFISLLKRTELTVSIHELAETFVGVVGIDAIDFIYYSIEGCLQEGDEKAYTILYKIIEEVPQFMFSNFEELLDLLLDLKPPADVSSLSSRFLCFKILQRHLYEITCDGVNIYGFQMLSEILLKLKDSKEETRKVAEELFLETISMIRSKKGPYFEYINLIMRHLSESSHIKSGAVIALSLLIHEDSKLCHLRPDIVPEILELLDSEVDKEVIVAVLGFLELLVLNIDAEDLEIILSDILSEVLPWFYVSEENFKSKVIGILKHMVTKCPSVQSAVPEKYSQDFVRNVLEMRSPEGEEKTETECPLVQSAVPEIYSQDFVRNVLEMRSPEGEEKTETEFPLVQSADIQPRFCSECFGGNNHVTILF